MNKILELAERMRIAQKRFYTKSDGVPRKVAYADLKTKEQLFDTELARRWRLKQTPITEDWLKEHGWVQIDSLSYTKTGGYGMSIRYAGHGEWIWTPHNYEQGVTCIDTLAQLYDACELCNIKID